MATTEKVLVEFLPQVWTLDLMVHFTLPIGSMVGVSKLRKSLELDNE